MKEWMNIAMKFGVYTSEQKLVMTGSMNHCRGGESEERRRALVLAHHNFKVSENRGKDKCGSRQR